MSTLSQPDDLHSIFWWRPHPIGDPIPWLQDLEQEARNQLLVTELELQQAILQAHLEANSKRIQILKGAATKP